MRAYGTWTEAYDFARTKEECEELTERHKALSAQTIGHSLFGRELICLSAGEGPYDVLYVASHHGMEHMTTALLLDFIEGFLMAAERGTDYFGTDARRYLTRRRLWFIPLLNPDGVELALHGLSDTCILARRLKAINGESEDFGRWQANGRGVDLNHNYDADFAVYRRRLAASGRLSPAPSLYCGEYPFSEPETYALARLILSVSPSVIVTLHTQGGEVFCGQRPQGRRLALARLLARRAGYRVGVPTGTAAYGGLTDWCTGALGIHAFTVECGRGKNPLPYAIYPATRRQVLPLLAMAVTVL